MIQGYDAIVKYIFAVDPVAAVLLCVLYHLFPEFIPLIDRLQRGESGTATSLNGCKEFYVLHAHSRAPGMDQVTKSTQFNTGPIHVPLANELQ